MSDSPTAASSGTKAAGKSPRKAPASAPAAAASRSAATVQKKALPPSLRRRSKRYRDLYSKADLEKFYTVAEAAKLLKTLTAGSKVDQTVNISMHLGIDPKQAEQGIRGSVSLPRGIGKAKKVIAFVPDDTAAAAAKAAGAIKAGGDELIKEVEGGFLDFDVAVTMPAMMGKVGKLGRVLGPAGKMPSPKNGTVTTDVATAVKEFAAGKVEFRNDECANVHAPVGKASFSADALAENITAFVEHIRRLKPQSSKGHFVRSVTVAGHMSPGVKLIVDTTVATEE